MRWSPVRRSSVRWPARLALGAVLAVGPLVGPAGSPASAAGGCSFDPGTGAVVVTLDGTPAVLARVAGPGGAITLDGTPCGTATVDTAETVTVAGSALADDLTVDLTTGMLAPGRTAESAPDATPAAGAIETTVDLGDGADRLRLLLGPGDDTLAAGTDGGSPIGFDLVSADHQDLVLAGAERLDLDLGAGDDVATLSARTPVPLPVVVQPGPGADDVTGGAAADTFLATPAATIADPEGDRYQGGDGVDTVDYSARIHGLVVFPTGAAVSGEGEEGDRVGGDVEDVLTGAGDDLVVGTHGPNTIRTGAGADVAIPRGGDDLVDLGTGADLVVAGPEADGSDDLTGGPDAVLDYSARTARVSVDLAAGGPDAVLDYSARTARVSVDLAAGEQAGPAGEHDLVAGFRHVLGGSGPDVLIGGPGADQLEAGPGADRLLGGGGADSLLGGDGDDVLRGGPGGDSLSGGPGADLLLQEAAADGADWLSGGPGVDLVDYGSRRRPVLVDLDGVADDGAAGERDDVRPDVENLRGGAAADRLVGSAQANRLDGAAGPDRLDGLAGRDVLACGSGADRAVRRPGDRYLGCETVR